MVAKCWNHNLGLLIVAKVFPVAYRCVLSSTAKPCLSSHCQSKRFPPTEAEIDVRMREEFSKVCFETLLQFSFSNKVSTPQEGYISRMALSVLLKRSQDVLRRYVEDERLSGRCPLPRYNPLCNQGKKNLQHVCFPRDQELW